MTGIYIFLFIIGLLTGSFLNVVSLRYKPENYLFQGTEKGRSRCPHCGKIITWLELFPVLSFIFLRGKCAGCGEKISWQYPIVEIISGLTTLGVPFILEKMYMARQLFLTGQSMGWFVVLSLFWILAFYFLIVAAIIDWRFKIVPNEINSALAVLGVLNILILDFFGKFGLAEGSFLGRYSSMFGWRMGSALTNHFLATVLAVILFGVIFAFSRGRGMGMGDVKLAGALGILFGWPDIALVIILSFIIGAVVGIKIIISKKGGAKTLVPFSPFLVISSFLVFFLGEVMVTGYFRLFGIY